VAKEWFKGCVNVDRKCLDYLFPIADRNNNNFSVSNKSDILKIVVFSCKNRFWHVEMAFI